MCSLGAYSRETVLVHVGPPALIPRCLNGDIVVFKLTSWERALAQVPGSAGLVRAEGVVHLDQESAVFEAMASVPTSSAASSNSAPATRDTSVRSRASAIASFSGPCRRWLRPVRNLNGLGPPVASLITAYVVPTGRGYSRR